MKYPIPNNIFSFGLKSGSLKYSRILYIKTSQNLKKDFKEINFSSKLGLLILNASLFSSSLELFEI